MAFRLDAFQVEIGGVIGVCVLFSVSAGTAMSSASLLSLAIEEEVAQDATGAPEEAVGPALDAALVLVEDEDGAGGDHLALAVDEAACDAGDEAAAGGLEDEEGVEGGAYPAGPGWGGCVGWGGVGVGAWVWVWVWIWVRVRVGVGVRIGVRVGRWSWW